MIFEANEDWRCNGQIDIVLPLIWLSNCRGKVINHIIA